MQQRASYSMTSMSWFEKFMTEKYMTSPWRDLLRSSHPILTLCFNFFSHSNQQNNVFYVCRGRLTLCFEAERHGNHSGLVTVSTSILVTLMCIMANELRATLIISAGGKENCDIFWASWITAYTVPHPLKWNKLLPFWKLNNWNLWQCPVAWKEKGNCMKLHRMTVLLCTGINEWHTMTLFIS